MLIFINFCLIVFLSESSVAIGLAIPAADPVELESCDVADVPYVLPLGSTELVPPSQASISSGYDSVGDGSMNLAGTLFGVFRFFFIGKLICCLFLLGPAHHMNPATNDANANSHVVADETVQTRAGK